MTDRSGGHCVSDDEFIMTGIDGRRVIGLSHDRLQQIMTRHVPLS